MWMVLWLLALAFSDSPAGAEPCPVLSPNDHIPDSCALQQLLDRGGQILLDAPASPDAPGYILDRGLRLLVSGTSLTGRNPEAKARMVSDPDIADAMLDAKADNFTLANLVFDGNRDNRRHQLATCRGPRAKAYNLILRGSGFKVHDLESTHALCGSAMAIEGSDFRIYDNRVVDNGFDIFEQPQFGTKTEAWSDGMTVWKCERGQIYNNTLADNTDIDIIVGGGRACQVLNNQISHHKKYAFGGLHVAWFPNGDGNHVDSLFGGNWISAESGLLHFGLMVGFHPWNADVWIENAGRIANNYTSGAGINLAVDGVRKAEIVSNTVAVNALDAIFPSCRVGKDDATEASIGTPPFAVHSAHAQLPSDELQPGAQCVNLDNGQCEPCSGLGTGAAPENGAFRKRPPPVRPTLPRR